jgi:hypothetical protein
MKGYFFQLVLICNPCVKQKGHVNNVIRLSLFAFRQILVAWCWVKRRCSLFAFRLSFASRSFFQSPKLFSIAEALQR